MGQSFGPFELERALGRGGMGEVFLASRRRGGTPLVLKRIRPEVAGDAQYRRRMLFEAQVASRLRHPNLVSLLEYGQVGDCPYLAMEMVEGWSLRRVLERTFAAREPPPLPVSLALAVGVLEGLGAMHGAVDEQGVARPILHRDITPNNVIVARDGRPVLIDFGIAKDVYGPAITQYGHVVGTARYMAPEHRLGQPADPRADVFSAALVAWEILVAERPWPNLPPHKEMLRTVFDPPEIEGVAAERIPTDVAPILLRGLSCEPSDRFEGAGAMAAALRDTDSFRAAVDPEAPWRAVADWLRASGLRTDQQLDELVVDHAPARVAEVPEDRAWDAQGRLRRPTTLVPDAVVPSDEDARITIPPLPPRRDASLPGPELELATEAALPSARGRVIAAAGALLLLALTLVWVLR